MLDVIKSFGKLEEDCINLCLVVHCRHPSWTVSISWDSQDSPDWNPCRKWRIVSCVFKCFHILLTIMCAQVNDDTCCHAKHHFDIDSMCLRIVNSLCHFGIFYIRTLAAEHISHLATYCPWTEQGQKVPKWEICHYRIAGHWGSSLWSDDIKTVPDLQRQWLYGEKGWIAWNNRYLFSLNGCLMFMTCKWQFC